MGFEDERPYGRERGWKGKSREREVVVFPKINECFDFIWEEIYAQGKSLSDEKESVYLLYMVACYRRELFSLGE